MPVWHEAVRELVGAGRLRVVGLTQEQHPDRCELYAQWQGLDFPILWDPFNLTRSRAVPLVMFADGSATLRAMRLDVREGAAGLEGLLEQVHPAALGEPERPYPVITREAAQSEVHPHDLRAAVEHGIAQLLFHRVIHGAPPTAAVVEATLRKLSSYAGLEGSPASARFHLGVALRLRHDSPHRRPGDFQGSIDAWMGALGEDPGQYIWRRRVQQWGPRLDKPYPFYDWVEAARTEVAARGEEPVRVRVRLTGAEVAGRTNEIPRREREDTHPDPGGQVPPDDRGLVLLEGAAAPHTGVTSKRVREPAGTARVHLVLRPSPEHDVRWSNDVGPVRVWVEAPEGWHLRRNLWTLPLPEGQLESSEVRGLDFEVRPPAAPPGQPPVSPPAPAVLRCAAFYPVCAGADGECTYLRQDLVVRIPVPPPRGEGGPESSEDD